MNKSIIFKIATYIFIAFLITSCGTDDPSELSDLIYVRHEGADMPAHIHGNGSENVFLIILHGGPGGNGLAYRAGTIKDQIEKEVAVVYFDQRGSGMSQGKYSDDGINIDIMAEDVMALTDVIREKYGNDSRFFLLGHSWGGTLGTATLLSGKNQDRFKGWIEVDGGHDLKQLYFENIKFFKELGTEQIDLNNNVKYWTDLLEKVNQVNQQTYDEDDSSFMNSEAFNAESILTEDGLIQEIDEDAAIETLGNALIKNNALTVFWSGAISNTALSDQGIWTELSYTNDLDKIKIPSLFLWGKYDMVIPPSAGQEAYENIGSESKKIVIFEKSGHSPMDNQGDEFASEVIEFIHLNK